MHYRPQFYLQDESEMFSEGLKIQNILFSWGSMPLAHARMHC